MLKEGDTINVVTSVVKCLVLSVTPSGVCLVTTPHIMQREGESLTNTMLVERGDVYVKKGGL